MQRGRVLFLKGITISLGVLVLISCIWVLPPLSHYIAIDNPSFAYLRIPVLAGVYMTVVPFLFALQQAFQLLSLIENDYVFTDWAIKTLGNIKFCAVAIIILYGVGLISLFLLNAIHIGFVMIVLTIMLITVVIIFFCVCITRATTLSGTPKIRKRLDDLRCKRWQ